MTIRNVPVRVVRNLKALAKRQGKSMEQQVRDLLEEHAGDRSSVLEQIEASWNRQTRRPSAGEIGYTSGSDAESPRVLTV